MALRCGIVGLPNVGKSTLFNAISSAKAEAANYPFCTIEPNVGVITVPDPLLAELAAIFKPEKITPATTQIVDIAGLVKGASKGEGLGNQFLAHIREVDAILHVVRCFVSEDIVHVDGAVDPQRDIEVIETELLLADLQTLDKRIERDRRVAKSGDKEARHTLDVLEVLKSHMDSGKPARTFVWDVKDHAFAKSLFLITQKPVLYVANSGGRPEEKPFIDSVNKIALDQNAKVISIDCGIESQIAELEPADRSEYLAGLGLTEPGLHRLIRAAYELLGLITYYTAGPKEVRAWTITRGTKAPQAAGVIHSDFEKGFICAEVYGVQDMLRIRSEHKLKEAGLVRLEGKDYVVHPDDVMLFRFNV